MLVEIIRPNGNPYRQVEFKNERFLVAPKKGRYHIRLSNNTGQRVMAVVSVDGLNIIHGKPCATRDQGYLLDPHQSTVIQGWTRTDEEVAEFKFNVKEASYSAQMGHGTKNTSVIGVAVFHEKEQVRCYRPGGLTGQSFTLSDGKYRGAVPGCGPAFSDEGDRELLLGCDDVDDGEPIAANFCCADSGARGMVVPESSAMKGGMRMRSSRKKRGPGGMTRSASPDLGTGYGKRTEMHTTAVHFEPELYPVETVSIRYATHAKLKEWGIPLCNKPSLPEPFPANVACQAPPGWSG